ncbi:metallophosphoesterase [Aeromonas veronii]|uniref:metallophosphoesterase n=1 Tax=Aeromonas veronii TaxID=654 RepID=UPI003004FA24
MKAILHISDLHLSNNPKYGLSINDCRTVSTALIADIKYLQDQNNFTVDSIFFTGDLVFSGQQTEFEALEAEFLSVIKKELSISSEQVYIAPGNHDIDRSKISILEKNIASYSDKDLSELFKIIGSGNQDWPRLDAYNNFIEKYYHSDDSLLDHKLIKIHKISQKLYIVCLNTSWMAMDDADKHRLRVTGEQIHTIQKHTREQDVKIILLCHHPIDWLNSEDSKSLSTFIEKKVSMMCYGHMHEFKHLRESSFTEGISIMLQAGTLDIKENNSGYSIILLNNKNNIDDGRILYRKFDKAKQQYTPWLERGNNGEFDFSTNSMITFDSAKFSDLSGTIAEELDKQLLINTGLPDHQKKRLSHLFSEPNLQEIDALGCNKRVIENTSDIASGNDNWVIFGSSDTGKTAILKYMLINDLNRQKNRGYNNISFYVSAGDIKLNSHNSILKHLCQFYFSPDTGTSFEEKIKRSLELGQCTIYIDNIHLCSLKESKHLFEFIKKFKSCKYIFSCSIDTLNAISHFSNGFTEHDFYSISIGGLRRANIRQMVSKWESLKETKRELDVYNNITKTIFNSQLPHNYFIYSTLLAIYDVDNTTHGILTESDVIENFIEILLRKHFMIPTNNKPQYKELLHFLGYISSKFFELNSVALPYNDILYFALEFNKKTLYSYNAIDYIDPLTGCGILIKCRENHDYIRFSQPSFLHFSLSYFMKHDESIKNKILSETYYLDHNKVVEYFAAQTSSNADILLLIKSRVDEIKRQVSIEIKNQHNIDINSKDIDKENSLSILDLATSLDDFEQRVLMLKADQVENDKELDSMSPLKIENEFDRSTYLRKEEEKKPLDNSVLPQVLSLYSRVFRNIELNMNREQTLELFKDILNGYMFYLRVFTIKLDDSYVIPIAIPAIEKHINENKLSENERNEILTIFKMILSLIRSTTPNIIQKMMSDNISSKKPRLENIIKEVKQSIDDPLSKALLCYLLMDIKSSNIKPCSIELLKENNSNVVDSLFFKLHEQLCFNYELNAETQRYIKDTLVQVGTERKLMKLQKIKPFFNGSVTIESDTK